MVKVVNYQKRVTEQGMEFFVLEVQGGVEMVKSQETNKFYLTARKALVPSTFDEMTCKALIGTDLPGVVGKVACEPYEYTIKDTGEIITLNHRYEYTQESEVKPEVEMSKAKIEDFITTDGITEHIPVSVKSFSENGSLVH